MRRLVGSAVMSVLFFCGAGAAAPQPPETEPAPGAEEESASDGQSLKSLLEEGYDLVEVEENFLYLKKDASLYRCLIMDLPVMCSKLA
ncbi:hypothetical protein [Henriciella aquimarina]|uniref:hypothetical protein n=1 Tax=Henriciella aquimarina TaxID=545261 RepID=UPI00117A49D4|nr:hypothetical protein [Henriciella aquimarina]